MAKRAAARGGAAGLRELLIAQKRKQFGPGSRWHLPNHWPGEYVLALQAGNPVLVSSLDMFGVCFDNGLSTADYCFDGKYFRATFLLDENDNLTEWTAEDQAEWAASRAEAELCPVVAGT